MKFRRWFGVLLIALIMTTAFIFLGKDDVMWEKVTDTFMKTPGVNYGAGDFYIYGDRVLSLTLEEPKLTFKTVPRSTPDPDYGLMFDRQVTEPWMKSTDEILKRTKVVLRSGPVSGPTEAVFAVPGDNGFWWRSRDGRVIYLKAAEWYIGPALPREREGYTGHKMYKSVDAGRHFTQMSSWDDSWHADKLHFRNPEEGYALGMKFAVFDRFGNAFGRPVIRRTADGGAHWQEIPVPPEAEFFDYIGMNTDGTLWFAFNVPDPENPMVGNSGEPFYGSFEAKQRSLTRLYRYRWGKDVPELFCTLPLADLKTMAYTDQALYISGQLQRKEFRGDFERSEDNPVRNVLLRWRRGEIKILKTFPVETRAGAVYVLPSGALVVDTVTKRRDVLYISRDQGESWKEEDEGRGAEGVYFNPETGERYRVEGYTLLKRIVK